MSMIAITKTMKEILELIEKVNNRIDGLEKDIHSIVSYVEDTQWNENHPILEVDN